MNPTGAVAGDGYVIPSGVEFLRWSGDGDWVIYHTGTGETLRVSDLALAILDHIERQPAVGRDRLMRALAALFDEVPEPGELAARVDECVRLLLSHECIERCPCV